MIAWSRKFRRKCSWDDLRRQICVSRSILSSNLSPDPSRISANNATEWRSGWTQLQQMYVNVHPNIALDLLFKRSGVESGERCLLPRCESYYWRIPTCIKAGDKIVTDKQSISELLNTFFTSALNKLFESCRHARTVFKCTTEKFFTKKKLISHQWISRLSLRWLTTVSSTFQDVDFDGS